jgi:hypothetical protein
VEIPMKYMEQALAESLLVMVAEKALAAAVATGMNGAPKVMAVEMTLAAEAAANI